MDYYLDKAIFTSGQMFSSDGNILHKTGNTFKLFPFNANTSSQPIENIEGIIGNYLCNIRGIKPKNITVDELIGNIKKETDIEQGDEVLFERFLKDMIYDTNSNVRPLNLNCLCQNVTTEPSEEKLADYLVDVLGDGKTLKRIYEAVESESANSANVIEGLLAKHFKYEIKQSDNKLHYFRLISALKDPFESDFKYVFNSSSRTRDSLLPLLEFYYFSYTLQTSMQLDRFLYGDRSTCIPVYFSLEWEKTSQSRKCFTEGWNMAQKSIERIFAHAVTLEILNHTPQGIAPVDYIAINEYVKVHPNKIQELSNNIDDVTNTYRSAIRNCQAMENYSKPTDDEDCLENSIKYLFESVRLQFENSVRDRAYTAYADKFKKYSAKFLKNRGRSGAMLNLSEENLIFLTQISIKDREKVRLKEVFDEFELRGVFLDDISREQVVAFFEKLNLIEKKSDSGDAMYVKRIL